MRKISLIVFFVLLMLSIVHVVHYYPLLPDRVASHFGASGQPDGWSSKEDFVKIYLVVMAFIAVLFSCIGPILGKVPISLINLANKDYWLSPECKLDTIAFLSRQFLWFGSATLLLLLDMMHQAFRVHLGRTNALDHPWISVMIYFIFSLPWGLRLIVKFARKPA